MELVPNLNLLRRIYDAQKQIPLRIYLEYTEYTEPFLSVAFFVVTLVWWESLVAQYSPFLIQSASSQPAAFMLRLIDCNRLVNLTLVFMNKELNLETRT